jgi:hypothetical protein
MWIVSFCRKFRVHDVIGALGSFVHIIYRIDMFNFQTVIIIPTIPIV